MISGVDVMCGQQGRLVMTLIFHVLEPCKHQATGGDISFIHSRYSHVSDFLLSFFFYPFFFSRDGFGVELYGLPNERNQTVHIA